MNIEHLRIQYDRLSRHHASALQAKDEVSFLDLAHSLRVWVDMKVAVTDLAKEKGVDLLLAHHTQPKYFKKSLQGARHTYIPLASGVESPEVQVKGLVFTNRAPTPDEIKHRAAMGPPVAQVSKMSFSEWMAAGVLEVPSSDATHPHLRISREMIIKRVANALGASHPAGMEQDDPQENKFDQYILELHALNVAGYPATYYQLLEIAGELLEKVRPLRDPAI